MTDPAAEPSVTEPGRAGSTPVSAAATGWARWLPGLQLLRGYPMAWLRHDIAAGLVLTTMLDRKSVV